MNFTRNRKNSIGLDIGHNAINLVELCEHSGDLCVRAITSTPTNGQSSQHQVVHAINTSKLMAGVRAKWVNTAIADHLTKTKKVTTDKHLLDYELEQYCQNIARQLFPQDDLDPLFDFQIIATNDLDATLNDVMVIVANPEINLELMFKQSKFTPWCVETKLGAFQRAALFLERTEQRLVCYVHHDNENTFLVVVQDGAVIHAECCDSKQNVFNFVQTCAVQFGFRKCFVSGDDLGNHLIKSRETCVLEILSSNPLAHFTLGAKVNPDLAKAISNQLMLAIGLALKKR